MMASLSSRPSVGRKPIGQVQQQHGVQQLGVIATAPYGTVGYQQAGVSGPGWQQHGPVQQPLQQQQRVQMQIQQPAFVQGQQQQASYQQPAAQHQQVYQQQSQQLQQPQQLQQQFPGQSFPQQSVQQQAVQQGTMQQWPGQQQQQRPQSVYQQTLVQQQVPQQQTVYQQQPGQQPVQRQTQQRPTQQLQHPVAQQPQQPVQQQLLQQQAVQPQPVQQVQQQIQKRPVQQQLIQQPPVQQQPTGQRLSLSSNAASHAINRQSISSAASVRSMGSVTSSHTNPSQSLGSPTSFPASTSQPAEPSFITCTLCSTDITNDSSHLECLACTAAQIPTLFCTQCCISKGAVTNHHHHMSNLISPSDVVTFDPEVSVHGWDVRKTAIGIIWYNHKGSRIKTFEKPKPPIPVTQPQVFPGDSNLDDGWEEIRDPDGRLFYYHRATKVSKWIRPPRNQLPPGWVECMNPDGRTYYLNSITQATTWERPTGSSRVMSDDQKSIRSISGAIPQTTEWSPTDIRQSFSSQGQSTATPQSPTSVRSSTILETSEWSPEVEGSTIHAYRTASVPNTFIETTNWSPSDPQHRPIPTRAETTPLPGAYQHHERGETRNSRTFSKDSFSNMRLPPGSATATKAVVKSTKTAATATAKGVKVAAKKIKNSKNAQKIIAGVGMAAVNAVLIDQFGVSIPVGVGTAAVGLVSAMASNETTTVVEATDADIAAETGSIADVTGDASQSITSDGTGDTASVNPTNSMGSNDYVVGGENEVVQTTLIQEEVVFVPGGPVPILQQPRQIGPIHGGPQHINNAVPRNAGSAPAPGTSEWEFESIMQRPAAMIGSHIPIHVPKNNNQRAVPNTGFHTQRPIQHQAPGLGPVGHGNLPQSYIPVYSHQSPNTMPSQNPPHNPGISQSSHQPGWATQPQIMPQYQGQNQQHMPQQPQVWPAANQVPHPQQANMPNQQQSNQNQPQWSQFHNPGPSKPQGQHLNQPAGAVPTQTPSKPLLKPHQKAALMKAGMKIGASLLKSAIRSEIKGNSGGDNYDSDDDDNDNSFDFGNTSDDGGNVFDSTSNPDNVTADYDPQDQVQNQFVDQDQQFDSGFGGSSDTGTTTDMNDYGGNNQIDDTYGPPDSGFGFTDPTQDQLTTDASGSDAGLSAQTGFNSVPDTSFNQQQAINIQAQGILQSSMNDDNAAMNGFYTAPDFAAQAPSIFQTSIQDGNAAMNGFSTTPDVTNQSPSIFQTSTSDGIAAMNGFSTSSDIFNAPSDGVLNQSPASSTDASFSLDTITDPSIVNGSSSIPADNLWTVNVPETNSLQSTSASQSYAGLTSASISGPMFDYYDSFAAYDGGMPLDEDSDGDQSQGLGTQTDTSSEFPTGGFLQDPTLASAEQETSELPNQIIDTPSSPGLNLNADSQSPGQSQDQSQDSDNQSLTQVDDIGCTTPTNSSPGMFPAPQIQTTAISQLYDGSGYGGADSEGNSPVDTQTMTATGTGISTAAPAGFGTGFGMSGTAMSAPSTPPVMPTPDAMPDPALLTIG